MHYAKLLFEEHIFPYADKMIIRCANLASPYAHFPSKAAAIRDFIPRYEAVPSFSLTQQTRTSYVH